MSEIASVQEIQKGQRSFFGYKAVVAAIVVSFLTGMNLGVVGICIPEVVERFNVSATEAGLGGTVETYVCCLVSLFFAGIVINKLGAKRTILISGVVCGLYAFVYIFAPQLWIILVFEAFVGASQAIGYVTGLNAFISDWFVEKRETIIGIAYAVTGFGASVGVLLMGFIQSAFGLDAGGIMFAFAAVVAVVLYLFFLKEPQDLGQKPLGWEHAAEIAKKTGTGDGESYGVGFKGALRTPSLYLMLLAVVLWGLALIVFPYEVLILESGGVDSLMASEINAAAFVFLALLAIVMGKATNKFGMYAYAILAFGCAILGFLLLGMWSNGGSFPLAVIASLLIGGGYSVGGTMGGMMCTQMFGTKDFEKITPLPYAMRSIGLGTGVFVIPALADAMGEWGTPLFVGAGMLAAALALTLAAIALSPMRKIMRETKAAQSDES